MLLSCPCCLQNVTETNWIASTNCHISWRSFYSEMATKERSRIQEAIWLPACCCFKILSPHSLGVGERVVGTLLYHTTPLRAYNKIYRSMSGAFGGEVFFGVNNFVRHDWSRNLENVLARLLCMIVPTPLTLSFLPSSSFNCRFIFCMKHCLLCTKRNLCGGGGEWERERRQRFRCCMLLSSVTVLPVGRTSSLSILPVGPCKKLLFNAYTINDLSFDVVVLRISLVTYYLSSSSHGPSFTIQNFIPCTHTYALYFYL